MILFIIVIACILGIILGLYFKMSIALFCLSIIFLNILFRRCIKNKKIRRYYKVIFSKKKIIIFIICFCISYLQIQFYENSFENKYQNVQDEIKVVGTIISNPKEKEYKVQYILKVDSINGNNSYKGTRLLLNVKKEEQYEYLQYGNKVIFNGEFELGEVQRNTGGFNYRFYLKTQKIYGIVTTKERAITLIKKNNTNIISKLANELANKISLQANLLLDKEKASLLTGILIGNKDGIDEETQENFRDSNLTHMLAVSGAHVSYILLGIGFIISKTKLLHKRFSKLGIVLLLFFFMLITKNTPSVMRACIMAMYLLIGNFCYKKVSILASLSFSMLIALIINPYCIFDIGLQLSYGGTIGIVYLYPRIKKYIFSKINLKKVDGREKIELKDKIIGNIVDMLLITISANLAIFPIMAFHFNTLSLTFIISNLLAGPIMGVIVIVGFVTIFLSIILFPISTIFSKVLSIFLYLFSKIAKICANLPFSKILIPTPSLFLIFIYYLILIFIVIRKKLKLKILSPNNKRKVVAIFLIIAVLSQVNNINIFNNLKVFFIDVRQGDSMLIITPKQKTILIDGGGNRDKESFDVGKQVLIPYLLDKGITKIDYCIISHFDSDHVRTDF